MSVTPFSEVFKNYVTAIAIIIGGLWAFYKWSFSEWLRHKKEMPAIDGFLDIKIVASSTKSSYVTLIAIWKNRSPLPFTVNVKTSGIDIFRIPKDIGIGVIECSDTLCEPLISNKPYRDKSSLTLEPMTECVLQSHYHLENGNTYLFRWQLFGSECYLWTKSLLYHIP